jgi:hypothetical protein
MFHSAQIERAPAATITLSEKVCDMQKRGKALILTAVLSGAANAYADNAGQNGLPSPVMQNPQNRIVPRIDYGNGFLVAARKTTLQESISHDQSTVVRGPVATPIGSAPTGLHWTPGAQHPALELRLSDQGTIRFHPTRHGGTVSVGWSF